MKNYTLNKMKDLTKNKLSRLGMFAMALGLTTFSFGQTITTNVATGTGTSVNNPIYGNYGYTYSQQIYLATDFNAAVQGQASQITKIRFFNVSGTLLNSSNWTVFMGSTAKTQFTSNTDWVPLASMQQVFTGTVTSSAANAWTEVTLATPFQWDGISNVVVAVDENEANYTGDITWRVQSTTTNNRSIHYRSDGTNPDPATPPGASGRNTYVPQAQFVHAPVTACAATPAHATAVASDGDICFGEQVTFSFTGGAFATGLEYVWQHYEGSSWVDFPNSNSSTFTTSALAATTNVRVVTKCIASTLQDASEDVTVVVNAIPVLTLSTTSAAFCPGNTVEVVASGAATYAWAPAAGLNVTNVATVIANPANATKYTVTGTNAAGCTATADTKIYPLAKVERTATFTPGENCAPGSPIAIAANVVPSTISGGGTWEYRFLGVDGTTVLQDWNTNNTYNFIPTLDSVYAYFYQIRSNNCPNVRIDSSKVSIPVGFGADVALIPYDCNTLAGTITLSNAFGQSEVAQIYSNTLGDPTNVANIAFTGAAAITAGRAVLTPSATSSSGAMTLSIPNFTPGANNSMTVSFLMTADQPVNVGADGLAYSFGDDVLTTAGSLQNGRGTKLRLSFDAIDNSTNNGNKEGIYLVYGWGTTTEFGPASTGVLAFTPNTASWKLKTDIPVVLSINAAGQATVTVDGSVIFSNIQLPPAYLAANVSTWKHHFGAQTGGYALRQAVSNFSITSGSLKYGITPAASATPPATWQSSQVFSGLVPGSYKIWMSKNDAGTCKKNIGTYEILNVNPVVELGNDTTICAGSVLTLDAGNVGSTYVWSNTNLVTQTITVTNPGAYVAYVTNEDGCVGIGTINVAVNHAPTGASIYSQGNYPTVFFSVINPEYVSNYEWNFGDGGPTVLNAPASISYTYTQDGTYNVTAKISNDCGTTTLTKSITIVNTASIAENQIEGLNIFPNPANHLVTVQLPESMIASVSVYSVTGAKIYDAENLQNASQINVQGWMKGIYFIHVQAEGKTSVNKLIVE